MPEPLDYETPTRKKMSPLHESLLTNVCLQVLLLVILSSVLDGGRMFAAGALAAVVDWLAVGVILVRRHPRLSPADTLFIKFGSLVMLSGACALAVLLDKG